MLNDGYPSDYEMAVGWNQVPNHRRVAVLGNSPAANAGSDIWTGAVAYPWMTAATALEAVSSSAADTAAGTGARTLQVFGLDADFVEVVQLITLNGTLPVALPTNLLRINTALIMSAGSGETNAGDISIRRVSGGTVQAIVPAGYGITRQAVYTVPAGFTLQITSILLSFNEVAGGNKFARFATFVRNPVSGLYRMPLEIAIGDEPPYRHDGEPGIPGAEKTDIAIRCTAVSTANLNLTAAFLGILKANNKA